MGSEVAVKKRRKGDTVLQSNFERELNAMINLHHPNIVQFRGYGYQEDEVIMITELMENGTLEDFIKLNEGKHKLNERKGMLKVKIVKHIASAMEFLHKQGYIHGDLTSKNVLLDDNYKAKVADFGLLRRVGTALGMSGHRCWAAPEYVSSDENINEKIDVYSFGII